MPKKILIVGGGLSAAEKQGLINALQEVVQEITEDVAEMPHEREGTYYIKGPDLPPDTKAFQCFDKKSRRRGQRRRDKRWQR